MTVDDKINIYEKNFITNAIFRVDFPEINLNTPDPPEELRKTIQEKFQIFHKITKGHLDLNVEDKNQVSTQLTEKVLWEFKNKKGQDIFNKAVIASDYVSLEYNIYNSFKEFYKDIQYVFNAFFDFYNIDTIKRIGLRYINQIELDSGNALDWDNLIDRNLFSVTNNFVDPSENILRSMQVLEVEEDDYLLRFQFGLYNSEYPNPIARKEFVLDYDCFIQSEMEKHEIFKHSERCNDIIYKWFERSIEQGLVEIMGVLENE